MDRRHFTTSLGLGLALARPAFGAAATSPPTTPTPATPATPAPPSNATLPWPQIEARVGGRLGVAVLDSGSGQWLGHRLDESFPMCSTFKWLAAALVLQRVDAGLERLDRVLPYGPEVLLPHSTVTARHVGVGLPMGSLCEASITVSDNAAANLMLASFGGPSALTAFARQLGDTGTRLDRWEPELNEARPGDPRDTTTPRGMAISLQAAALGTALHPASRAQLVAWLVATRTGMARLRAHLPADWQAGDKTGTGDQGSTNDVAVVWPPGRAPLVIAAYLTECKAPLAAREAALAEVGRVVLQTPPLTEPAVR